MHDHFSNLESNKVLLILNEKEISSACHLSKGSVKLIKRVKIAQSFLQSVSDQFQVIILSLPM